VQLRLPEGNDGQDEEDTGHYEDDYHEDLDEDDGEDEETDPLLPIFSAEVLGQTMQLRMGMTFNY